MVRKRKSKDYTNTIIALTFIPVTIFFFNIGFWNGLLLTLPLFLIAGHIGNIPDDQTDILLDNTSTLFLTISIAFGFATGLKIILIITGIIFSPGSTYSYEDCVKSGIFRAIDPGVILHSCEHYK